MTSDLIRKRLVGRAAEEFETPVFAQVAGPLALGGRFGFLRFRTSLRLHGLFHPSIAGGSRRLPAACLPTLPVLFPLPSPRYLQAGWLWLHSRFLLQTLAGRLGFEPRQVPPKGTVLPLDDRPTSQISRLPWTTLLSTAVRESLSHKCGLSTPYCRSILSQYSRRGIVRVS